VHGNCRKHRLMLAMLPYMEVWSRLGHMRPMHEVPKLAGCRIHTLSLLSLLYCHRHRGQNPGSTPTTEDERACQAVFANGGAAFMVSPRIVSPRMVSPWMVPQNRRHHPRGWSPPRPYLPHECSFWGCWLGPLIKILHLMYGEVFVRTIGRASRTTGDLPRRVTSTSAKVEEKWAAPNSKHQAPSGVHARMQTHTHMHALM
jgi:hypothetical protein